MPYAIGSDQAKQASERVRTERTGRCVRKRRSAHESGDKQTSQTGQQVAANRNTSQLPQLQSKGNHATRATQASMRSDLDLTKPWQQPEPRNPHSFGSSTQIPMVHHCRALLATLITSTPRELVLASSSLYMREYLTVIRLLRTNCTHRDKEQASCQL